MNLNYRILSKTIFLLAGIILFHSAHAQQQDLPAVLDTRGEAYFSFNIDDKSLLNDIGRHISIDNVQDGLVFAYANSEGFKSFLEYNIKYTILTPPSELIQPLMTNMMKQKGVTAWNAYPTYTAYLNMMAQFELDFPHLCRIDTMGTLPSGRLLLVARIGDNPDSTEAEPEFFYTSTMHGDEVVGYVLMLRLIDTLLNGYGNDAELTDLVNNVDIWINPNANPDGTYRYGDHTLSGARRYNANGVDLNRNFPDPQNGPHPDGKAWQPETLFFMDFADNHNLIMASNIHGGAEVCNYPWDTWSLLTADNSWWYYVCRNYADTVHNFSPASYMNDLNNGVTNGYAWYTTNGSRQDYMNYFHHCREFILEVSASKFPSASLLPAYWNYNYRSLINYIKETLNGIQGTVTDSLTGEGIRARVWVNNHDVDSSHIYTSLPHGNYSRPIYTGTYSLTFSAPDYYPKTYHNVSVVNGQAMNLDVQLVSSVVRYKFEGRIEYADTISSLLPGVKVNLSTTQDPQYFNTITDSQGEFLNPALRTNTYQLTASSDSSWRGGNSTDALLVAINFVQLGPPLTGLRLEAADVNDDGYANTIDALLIQRRFVGLDSSFVKGDWIFETKTIVLDKDTTNLQIRGICVGDVNASRYYSKQIPALLPKEAIIRRANQLQDR